MKVVPNILHYNIATKTIRRKLKRIHEKRQLTLAFIITQKYKHTCTNEISLKVCLGQ